MKRILLLLLIGSFFISGSFLAKTNNREGQGNPPNFAIYLNQKPYQKKELEIADFKEIEEKEKLIESLIGEYGGSCKEFTNKYSEILGLKVGKGKFHPKFYHYFLIISETKTYWEVLDSNWDLKGIIIRHKILK